MAAGPSGTDCASENRGIDIAAAAAIKIINEHDVEEMCPAVIETPRL